MLIQTIVLLQIHILLVFSSISFGSLGMFSPIVGNIKDLTIENNFSIQIYFNTTSFTNTMIAFNIQPLGQDLFHLYYKQNIVLNNSTLFPSMQEYVKTSILNIS